MQAPASITVTDSGLFLDGGSIRLTVVDPLGFSHQLFLDLSFVSRDRHYVQFYLNGVVVLKNSAEEAEWLTLLEHANLRDSRGIHAESIHTQPWTLSPAQTSRALQNKTLSALQLTRYLVSVFCETIRSADYDLPPNRAVVDLFTMKPVDQSIQEE